MPTSIFSWNLQGQNPYDPGMGLVQVSQVVSPDIVFLSEVGDTALYNYVSNLWIENELLLEKVREHSEKLNEEENVRLETVENVLYFKGRYNAGFQGGNAFVTRNEMAPSNWPNVRRNKASAILPFLQKTYAHSESLLTAENYLNNQIGEIRKHLTQKCNISFDRPSVMRDGSQSLHPYHAYWRNNEFIDMKQDNRNYLVFWNGNYRVEKMDFDFTSVHPKRPLLSLVGNERIFLLHAIANKYAARKQLREVATKMTKSFQESNIPACLIGDLNCDREFFEGDSEMQKHFQAGMRVWGPGIPTQYSGNELDYALGIGFDQSQGSFAVYSLEKSDHKALKLLLQ